MTGNDSFHKNLESLKISMNHFFEDAECTHAQMLGWKAQNERANNLFCSIETYFSDLNYETIDPAKVFDKRQELLEEVREFLYS